MNAVAEQVPAKCPECGRLSVENRRHCHPKDEPGAMEKWAKHCLTLTCAGCGAVYHNYGHISPKVAR